MKANAWGLACLLLGIAVTLVPTRYWPLGTSLDVNTTFAGKPVEIAWPHSKPAAYRLEMNLDRGICDFTLVSASGEIVSQWSAQRITSGGHIKPGEVIRLAPQSGAVGRCRVRIGTLAVLGWAVNGFRAALFLGCAVVVLTLGRKPVHAPQNRTRWYFAAVVCAFSGGVLYSVVHEGGHLLFGWLFGATPDFGNTRWTILSGEQPRAAFTQMPPAAAPWMSAGGVWFPMLTGLALIGLWLWRADRAKWWQQGLLFIPGALLLFPGMVSFVDTEHTQLATHLGLRGVAAYSFAWIPALLALAAFAVIARRMKSFTKLLFGAPANSGMTKPATSRSAGLEQESLGNSGDA